MKHSTPPASLFAACSRGNERRYPHLRPLRDDLYYRQRNIFRQAFQKRADASLIKQTKLTERYALKYTFDVYNLTNTTSFDVPGNEVSQNANFNSFPNAARKLHHRCCTQRPDLFHRRRRCILPTQHRQLFL